MSRVASSASRSAEPADPAGVRLTVAPEFAAALAEAGVDTLDDLFALAGGQRLDKPTLPAWRERLRIELPGIGPCYVKRYRSPPLGVQVRRMLSGHPTESTAGLEWRQMGRLAEAGIEGVKGLAFGERMVGPWERCSAVVTAELPGESLERYLLRCPGRVARGWLVRLASFVARFHRAGFIHRDLYLCHVFVEVTGPEPVFGLIDLARMMKPRLLRRRWMVKELASLDYSTPAGAATAWDRLRFLKAYLGLARLGPADRRLARQIARKTRRIAQHDARLRAAARSPA